MKTQLVKLKNNRCIVVSDDEAKYGDSVWNGEHILEIAKVFTPEGQKVIAGFDGLPLVDFSELTEDEIEEIGWIVPETKVWDCEVEMEVWNHKGVTSLSNVRPKITNNKIKITKIL
jgi:hypothetical protein